MGNVSCTSKGAFCTLYNVLSTDAALVLEGVKATTLAKDADMHWQAFRLQRRAEMYSGAGGASQPVA